MDKSIRVIGIDPGIANVGIAILEIESKKIKHIWSGLIKTEPIDSHAIRLYQIWRDLRSIILNDTNGFYDAVCKIKYAAIEKVFVRASALTKLTEARGVILALLGSQLIECRDYNVAQVKKAITGDGKANKDLVQDCVRQQLGLKPTDIDPNVSDAMALAYSLCLDLQRENK